MKKFRKTQVGLGERELVGALEELSSRGWDIISVIWIGSAYEIVYSRSGLDDGSYTDEGV